MDYFIICFVSLAGSALTLFSGFGLGTLLVPVFGLFFPIEVSIMLTAIVHFLNNLFKVALVGKHADKSIILHFGIPSILAAFIGAYLLSFLTDLKPIASYTVQGKVFFITPVKISIAALLTFFALFDIIPALSKIQFDKKYLSVGGLLSGFIGGLSGNQGALRTAFLLRTGLSKETFIGTGIAIACLTDISRLIVYAKEIFKSQREINYTLVIAATLSAFIGAYLGNKFLKKITITTIQYLVVVMLLIFAILLGFGII